MKIKKLLYALLFFCGVFILFFTNEKSSLQLQPEIKTTEIKTSGAGKAMDLWAFSRAYPDQSIPYSKYEEAFQLKKMNASQRSASIEGNWESLGPENVGGRTLCLAFHPTDPDIIYAGSASGGLWKTTTQGVGRFAWEYVPTGFPVLGVASIAIDQNDPNIMFIGTGEVYGSGLAEPGTINRFTRGTYGIGILKSTNGGDTWSQVLSFNENQLKGVQDIVINPQNSLQIFAATTDGVYRSLDGGENWTLVFNQPDCIDIEIDPNNGGIIYVSQGNFNGNLNPALSGIFKSTNGGNSFIELTDTNLLTAWSGNAKLALDPSNSNIIYASIQVGWNNQGATTPGGIFKSTNGGANWSYINNQNIARFQGWYSHDIAINPTNTTEIQYVGIDSWKSTDSGNNFIKKSDWSNWPLGEYSVDNYVNPPNLIHADIHAVYYHPLVTNKVFYATDGGMYTSIDNGETFDVNNGGMQTIQFYADMSSSATDPDLIIAGAQDNSTWIYRGQPSWFRNIGGDGMSTAINQNDDSILYGSAQNLTLFRSTDGENWNLIFNFQNSAWVSGDFSAFLGPFEVAPSNQNIIYGGTKYLYKSTNEGSNWAATTSQAIDGSNVITKIAISPINPDILYVATSAYPLSGSTSTPKLFKSINGGQSFTQLTGLPNRICSDIEIDPSNDNNIYATFSGFGTSHVYKTTDAGNIWLPTDNNLPDLPTNTILIDPLNPEDIYVGNDLGVYYSNDFGDSWEEFSDALPEATMVMDLNTSPSNRKVRIATHGHGMYQRDFVQDPLSVPTFNISESGFKMYPNPVSNKLTIEVITPINISSVDINLYNTLGQKVLTIFSGQLTQGSNTINWNRDDSISAGSYFLEVKANGFSESKTLIIR